MPERCSGGGEIRKLFVGRRWSVMAESGLSMGAALGSRVFSVYPPSNTLLFISQDIRGIMDSLAAGGCLL